MASAGSPSPRSYGPARRASWGWFGWQAWGIVVCLGWIVLDTTERHGRSHILIPLVAGLFLAWELHLESSCLSPSWSVALAIAVASQWVIQSPMVPELQLKLASGVLLYLMLWALSSEHTSHGLQSIATMALLLSLSLFTSAGCLFSALFLTLVALVNSRGRFGRYSETALLLFTPAALCLLVGIALHALSIATLPFPLSRLTFRSLLLWRYTLPNQIPVELVSPIMIAFAALFSRMLDSRTDVVDLSYLVLLAAHSSRILAKPNMDAAGLADFQIVILAGAMCLLAVGPPRRLISRLLVMVALCASFAVLAANRGIL